MSKLLYKSERFVFGKCLCCCGADIPIRTNSKPRILQRFKRWHGGNLIKKGEYRNPSGERKKGNTSGFQKGELNPTFGKQPPNYKGRLIDENGYFLIHSPKHPFKDNHGHVREHRLVMEKHLGRYLLPTEEIHHKNGNKQDNRIESLQLTTKSEHLKLHYPKGSRFGVNKKRQINSYGNMTQ